MVGNSRAVIFANGEITDLLAARSQLRPGDTLIAADGGMRHMQALDLLPSVVIGDLDSLPPESLQELKTTGARILKHPTHKDETDLELALGYAAENGFTSIVIMGGLGGRLDQTLGNIALLADPGLRGLDVRLDDGHQQVFRITQIAEIDGETGDTVSLLPLEGEARKVVTSGLEYPLRGETLYPFKTRGISNIMSGKQAQVQLDQGVLLCIHTRGKV